MNRIVAAATRWLNREKTRTPEERAAYIDGMFDAGISNEEQAAVEALFKDQKEGQ